MLDLRRAGAAFRVRWEWLWRTDSRRTWCDLPSSTEKAVQAIFQAATESVVGDGSLTLPCSETDRWLQGRSIQQLAPDIGEGRVSFAIKGLGTLSDMNGALTFPVLLDYILDLV